MSRSLCWLLAAGLFSALACSTELEVNAPWEENTVLFGVLNPDSTVHRVRITRAFLSTTNPPAQDAQIADSSEYAEGDLQVELFVRQGTQRARVGSFVRVALPPRQPGTFHSDGAFAYQVEAELDERRQYEVQIVNRSGDTVSAITGLPNTYSVTGPNDGSIVNLTRDLLARTGADPSGGATELHRALFTYERYTAPGQFTVEPPVSVVLNRRLFPIAGGNGLEARVPGGDILIGFANQLDASGDPPQVFRRLRTVEFEFVRVSEAFTEYIRINQTLSPITQTTPFYTNVSNGIGLLAGRRFVRVTTTPNEANTTFLQARYPALNFQP